MAFDSPEAVAEKLSHISVDSLSSKRPAGNRLKALPGDKMFDGHKEETHLDEISDSDLDSYLSHDLWRESDVILKTKNAIFDDKNKLNNAVAPLVEEFVKARYFADTKEEALKKVQDNDLGKSASEFLMASEFLHFLKDKNRWDLVERIEKKSSVINKPEVKKIEKHEQVKDDSLDLKLNKRRIESHLEPDIIKHVDHFVAVYGSGAVTKVRVDVKQGVVSAIKLFYNRNDGPKSVFLSREVFHDAFDGVSYYRDNLNSDPSGLSFIDNDGDMQILSSNTTDDEAKEIFSQLSIGGKKLSGDFKVVVNKS